jgi:DNA-binding CsgD family transcriptional regulator
MPAASSPWRSEGRHYRKSLTDKELAALAALGEMGSYAEAARLLGITVGALHYRLISLYNKLGAPMHGSAAAWSLWRLRHREFH